MLAGFMLGLEREHHPAKAGLAEASFVLQLFHSREKKKSQTHLGSPEATINIQMIKKIGLNKLFVSMKNHLIFL